MEREELKSIVENVLLAAENEYVHPFHGRRDERDTTTATEMETMKET